MIRTAKRVGGPRERERGFTMLELAVSLTFIALAFGGALSLLARGPDAVRSTHALSELNQKATRLLDRMSSLLMQSSPTQVEPAIELPTTGSPSITFRRALDYVDGAIVWGNQERFAFRRDPAELDDGIDNDGDGMVDEGEVIYVINVGEADEQTTVLAGGVRELLTGEEDNLIDDDGNGMIDEAGLTFRVVNESNVVIRLTLQTRGPAGLIYTKDVESSVTFRN